MVAESSQIAVRLLRKTISFEVATQGDGSDLAPVAGCDPREFLPSILGGFRRYNCQVKGIRIVRFNGVRLRRRLLRPVGGQNGPQSDFLRRIGVIANK
jgi:hypothetical protein